MVFDVKNINWGYLKKSRVWVENVINHVATRKRDQGKETMRTPRMRKNVTGIDTVVLATSAGLSDKRSSLCVPMHFVLYVLPRFRSNLINVESKTLPVNCRNKDKCIKRISSAFHFPAATKIKCIKRISLRRRRRWRATLLIEFRPYGPGKYFAGVRY